MNVSNGPDTQTLSEAYGVYAFDGGGGLYYSLVIPAASRGDLNGVAYLDYSNTGQQDIPAPYFLIYGPNTQFELAGQSSFSDSAIEALGISTTGLAGILAPGESGSIPITYKQITIESHQQVDLSVADVDTEQQADLSLLQANLQPTDEPADAWNADYSNLEALAAANPDGLTGLMRQAANELSEQGTYSGDPGVLLNYVLQSADDFGAIARRYLTGIFGRGQADPYTQTLSVNASGDVSIFSDGLVRSLPQADQRHVCGNARRRRHTGAGWRDLHFDGSRW